MEPAIALGIGVRLVAGVDDRAAPSGGRRHSLPDVFGALRYRIHSAASRLQQFPGSGPYLAAHEKRDQSVDHPLEVTLATDQVVLVAAVGVSGGIGVVLEEVDLAPDALLCQSFLGGVLKSFEHPLPCPIVGHEVVQAVALRSGVLGVAPDIQVEPGAVLEEDVGASPPGDHPTEQVTGHFVGRQTTLPAECASHSVLVLHPEDPAFHGGESTADRHIGRAGPYD